MEFRDCVDFERSADHLLTTPWIGTDDGWH
jgi:hypothetical protein